MSILGESVDAVRQQAIEAAGQFMADRQVGKEIIENVTRAQAKLEAARKALRSAEQDTQEGLAILNAISGKESSNVEQVAGHADRIDEILRTAMTTLQGTDNEHARNAISKLSRASQNALESATIHRYVIDQEIDTTVRLTTNLETAIGETAAKLAAAFDRSGVLSEAAFNADKESGNAAQNSNEAAAELETYKDTVG